MSLPCPYCNKEIDDQTLARHLASKGGKASTKLSSERAKGMVKAREDKKEAIKAHILKFNITEYDLNNIRHMTGSQSRYPRKQWGFRNHFCAGKNGQDFKSMQKLLSAGYVSQGIEQETSIFFHATKEGCEAVGMNKKQIQTALSSH
ncbi:MAG: hypothetical protein KAJ10_10150 [Thermodesulfovibrionia bacterium]|nr:hypothetical protein [Thermodesulfovibrionia bacterium]